MTVNRNGVDQGAVSKRTVTAKGNLIVGTANSVVSNLAVGNDGEQIVADSAATTGLRYQGNQAAGKNIIINGGFDIWQRGTTFTAADVYTADRWGKDSQTYSTMSRQTTSDTTNLPNIQYCARIQRAVSSTSTFNQGIIYTVETADAIRLAGQSVVVSFYARAGANYSSASSLLNYNFYTGTGTDQRRSFPVGFTGEVNIASASKTLTTTWQRFSFTATVGATATELALMFLFAAVGTAGANDYFEITGVQLELGSVATAFSRAGGTIQGELAACQRYYFRLGAGCAGIAAGVQFGHYLRATATSTTNLFGELSYPVTMRSTPTAIDFSGVGWIVSWGGGVTGISAITIYDGANVVGSNPQSAVLQMTTTGVASSTSYPVIANNSTASFIGLSAEL